MATRISTSGDLNGDGKIDLVTVNRGGGNNNEGSISIGLSDGAGQFVMQPNVSVRTAVNPVGAAFADFNEAGKMDLAVPSGFGFSILLGNGSGGFAPRTHITTANSSSIRTADVDGDGNIDLVMVSEEINGKTSVVRGDGTGGFMTFPLVFEGLHSVPNFPWLTQIILRLPSEIANSDEVSITVKVRGTAGNKVLVKVKP